MPQPPTPPTPPTRALSTIAVAAPLALIIAGPGRGGAAVGLLGALGLIAIAARARARLREGSVGALESLAAAIAIALYVFAVVLGGPLYAWAEQDWDETRHLVVTLAIFAALGLGALDARAWLLAPVEGSDVSSAPPPNVRALAAILGLAALAHGAIFLSLPPLTQCDSYCNLYEPAYFERGPEFIHHPPVYVFIVKAFAGYHVADPARWLPLLVLLQHATALATALCVERAIRLETKSAIAAALGAALVAFDGFLTLYAQSIMSETTATALGAAGALCLVEARHRADPRGWLALAGIAAALAVLTRQACEGWFVVGLAWLLVSPLRPRLRAGAIFVACATLPVLGLALHNYCFHDRPTLTANDARCLVYRVVENMPPLTDPDAPPGDELERARRLVWENRDNCWIGPWSALQTKLGWDDAKINAAVHRFYFEQMRKHPAQFAAVTARYAAKLAFGDPESWELMTGVHNGCIEHAEDNANGRWRALGPVERLPAIAVPWHAASALVWRLELVLAIAAVAIARGAERRFALLGLGSVVYFVMIAAITQPPVPRFRIPATPFLAMGATVALAAAASRARERRVRVGEKAEVA